MAILSKGTDFSTGDQVTAANLDALVDSATFASGAVDNTTTALDGSSPARLIVKDEGISATKLATNAVSTVKVQNNAITLAKMATQADQTVLANVSGGTAVPTAVPIVDNAGILINNDSLGTNDTKGATQGNIKVYADASPKAQMIVDGSAGATYTGQESVTFPNGLTMKFGSVDMGSQESKTITFDRAFDGIVQVQVSLFGIIGSGVSEDDCAFVQVMSNTAVNLLNGAAALRTIKWMAIGYTNL